MAPRPAASSRPAWLVVAIGLACGCAFERGGTGSVATDVDAGGEVDAPADSGDPCANGRIDGTETDVDCGGDLCGKCAAGRTCSKATDCLSGSCASGKCVEPSSCSNGARDGDETDVDCGGPCTPCKDGDGCLKAPDCKSGVCAANKCAAPSCTDAVINGTETDLDCGGSCPPCGSGKQCAKPADCASGFCDGLICRMPRSCRAIKDASGAAKTGTYRIDPDGAGPVGEMDVWCDMDFEGGGWTFVAYVEPTYKAARLFEEDTGVYFADRRKGTTYGIGGRFLKSVPHTAMLFLLDGSDPAAAWASSKGVIFEYAAGVAAFGTGPVPCSGLAGFNYRVPAVVGVAGPGTTNGCDAKRWQARTVGDAAYLTAFSGEYAFGLYWGKGMGGDDSSGHEGFVFVR